MSTDIRIIGIDENRPPIIRKEPYIDIYFKLSQKATTVWCTMFNDAMAKHPSSAKIKEKEGLFIDTWVRKPDEIPDILKLLRTRVAECNQRYDEKLRAEREQALNASSEAKSGGGEQARLNRIIAELEFDESPEDAQQKIAG